MAILEFSALLALAAALCYGLSAVTVDGGLARAKELTQVAPAFGAAFLSIIVSVAIFWTIALVQGIPVEDMSLVVLAPFLITGILYPGVFRLCYYIGIDRIGPNVASAVLAAYPAVSALIAIPFLGERLTLGTGVGLLAIVGGGALLSSARPADEAEGTSASARDLIVRELEGAKLRDALYPLGSVVSVGLGLVLISIGLDSFPHPVTATAITQSISLVVFLLVIVGTPTGRQQVRMSVAHRGALLLFGGAGLFVALAWLAQFIALQTGDVVIVAPLIGTFPLVIAVASYGFARELPRSPNVIVGIVAIVVGAGMMQAF